ncbi:ABC transporter permease [Bradyrhizobium sp. USDA 10063]
MTPHLLDDRPETVAALAPRQPDPVPIRRTVVIPGALPFIIAGLRVSLSVALVVLVAAELAGAAFGVGYLIQMSQHVFRVDEMFVGLMVLGAMGFAADLLFERAVRRLLPWYGAEAGRTEGPADRASLWSPGHEVAKAIYCGCQVPASAYKA